jgi:flagellar basal-body rod protein FlgC
LDLGKSFFVSASGLRAQATRLRVIAENIANSSSTAQSPGGEPYRRRLVSFGNILDRALGIEKVQVTGIFTDSGDFGRRLDPGHPAADQDGYVLTPNVNTLVEMSDMREAQRSYEANLKAIQAARSMLRETVQILRS